MLRTCDTIAKRYHQRPSALVGIDDPWLAFQVDVVCADAGVRGEIEALQQRKQGGKSKGGSAADALMLQRLAGGAKTVVGGGDDWWKQLF